MLAERGSGRGAIANLAHSDLMADLQIASAIGDGDGLMVGTGLEPSVWLTL